ncbi:RelB antitoxin [Legionella wadsworthii]|uniref:RelB antitoxin n=1 Tax=Legionella wadsworthii TaxID=28088 RepID=A0A378P9A2_9GAMM|nr:type II toxin-antitoxin system RelB/DinJ family antitoxin [Legionella wadsworthii]STY78964.1 RelB antitoxin [Legionella wadsworthii]
MSRAASIHARIDPKLKHDAEKILHQLGLNTSQAIKAFYAQIAHVRGIPFELKLPNEETIAAMKELDSGKVKAYDSMKEIFGMK